MKLKEIKVILGGDVSTKNSKMPGTSFGLSTDGCRTGGKLRECAGSVCEKCYARRLESFRPSVKQGWLNRTMAVGRATLGGRDAMEMWVGAMVERLTKLHPNGGYHRWHDSGDLLSLKHLRMIAEVARRTPQIKHWLPTKEYKIIKENNRLGYVTIPDNLNIRVSAPMVYEGLPVDGMNPKHIDGTTSSVVFKGMPPHGYHVCPASKQGNKCDLCRACWSRNKAVVAYPIH